MKRIEATPCLPLAFGLCPWGLGLGAWGLGFMWGPEPSTGLQTGNLNTPLSLSPSSPEQTYNQCEVDLFELLCKVLDQNLFTQVDWARNSYYFKDLKVNNPSRFFLSFSVYR